MGREYTTLHAAELLAQVPRGSRVAAAYDPDSAWTLELTLMAAMVNDLNWLVWSRTEDARHRRNKPRPIGPFRDDGTHKKQAMAMNVDELDAALARARRAVAEDG